MTRKWLAKNICDIELFPYHSKKFKSKWAKAGTELESVHKAREAVINAIDTGKEIILLQSSQDHNHTPPGRT